MSTPRRYKHHTLLLPTSRKFVVIERDGKSEDLLCEAKDLRRGDVHYILDSDAHGNCIPFQTAMGNNVFVVAEPPRMSADGTYSYMIQEDRMYFDPAISSVYSKDYANHNAKNVAPLQTTIKPRRKTEKPG